MSFVLQSRYGRMVSLPIFCPQLELRPGDSSVVSAIALSAGQRLSLKWLSLSLTKVCTVPGSPGTCASIVGWSNSNPVQITTATATQLNTGDSVDIVVPNTVAIAGATSANPIQVTTQTPTQFQTGDFVTIGGVSGNTAANVELNQITVLDGSNFTLNGVNGNGTYGGGGYASDMAWPGSNMLNCTITVIDPFNFTINGTYAASASPVGGWVRSHSPLVEAPPSLVNGGLGLAYAGVYPGGFNSVNGPSGVPMSVVAIVSPGLSMINPYHSRNFESPDTYEVVVVNNTKNAILDVALSGSVTYTF